MSAKINLNRSKFATFALTIRFYHKPTPPKSFLFLRFFMNIVLFDDYSRYDLLPLTYTRPIADLRIGVLTLREKWTLLLGQKPDVLTVPYLQDKYLPPSIGDNCYINAALLPTPALLEAIQNLSPRSAWITDNTLIAFRSDADFIPDIAQLSKAATPFAALNGDYYKNIFDEKNIKVQRVRKWWDIFALNDKAIAADFEMLSKGRLSQTLDSSNRLIGPSDRLFIEEGALITAATLNTSTGPIYICKDAEIMEGVHVRGPFALGEHAALKMGAKIYGATTIGPYTKVGGEVSNSVILGYSNKAHDGFMGNSVIGEWCNWGADSNNSNLKNNYGEVQVWDIQQGKYTATGRQFCGMVMGDHAKCGINTMFNTGTVVGVCANIFGAGFPPKFIPSFAWGGGEDWTRYDLQKAIETAKRVYERRQIAWTDADSHIFSAIFSEDFAGF